MKTNNYTLIVILCISLLLTSCLSVEKLYLSIDLNKKIGEIKYFNIVSDSEDKEEIEADFKELIENNYLGDGIQGGLPSIKITSKKLYGEKGHLNGKVRFTFVHLKDALNDFDIEIDANGNYFYELDNGLEYTNGTYYEQDLKKQVKWDKNTETIELYFRIMDSDDTEVVSLLPYWLEWKKNN